jgi:CheY-like chemotaxis protein
MNTSSLRDVLVVDDNDGVREGIAEFFRHLGLDVATASNGREALDRLAESPYAVMLLDYQMPELNGLEVVNELRRRPTRPVVLMMTGLDDIDALPIDGAIVQTVLRKPFELEPIAGIIQACINTMRGHDVVPAATGTEQ